MVKTNLPIPITNEVEEWHKCQETLEKALAMAEEDSKDFGDLVILPELVCANQLGILWCNRGDMEKAKSLTTRPRDASISPSTVRLTYA